MRLLPAVILLALSSFAPQDPMDARGWLDRGVQEFEASRYPQAVAAFQRAVRSDPSSVTAHLYLATAWMQQWIPGAASPENEIAAAAAERGFLKVLDLDKANTTAISYLASMYLNQKKWDASQRWYERLLSVNPEDAVAWYSLAFLDWSRWYPADEEARSKLSMPLDAPGPLPAGAIKAELRTRYEPVIEHGLNALHRALEIDPEYDDAMAYLNLLIRERADLLDTREEYDRAIVEANQWVEKVLAKKKARLRQ